MFNQLLLLFLNYARYKRGAAYRETSFHLQISCVSWSPSPAAHRNNYFRIVFLSPLGFIYKWRDFIHGFHVTLRILMFSFIPPLCNLLPNISPSVWAFIARSTGTCCPALVLWMPTWWAVDAHATGMVGPANGCLLLFLRFLHQESF